MVSGKEENIIVVISRRMKILTFWTIAITSRLLNFADGWKSGEKNYCRNDEKRPILAKGYDGCATYKEVSVQEDSTIFPIQIQFFRPIETPFKNAR